MTAVVDEDTRSHVPQVAPTRSPDAGPDLGLGRSRVRGILADVIGLGALSLVALSGFGPAFGGTRYLFVGALGLVLGGALAGIGVRLRLPVVLVGAAALVLLVLVGPWLTDPSSWFVPSVPSVASARDALESSIRGWADLLTTTVPVGAAQGLLVLPWTCGLVCGVVSLSTARRAPGAWSLLALVPPLVVLVAAIVVGVDEPAWPLQASAFVVVAVMWGGDRQRVARSGALPVARRGRWVAGLGVLAVVALVGLAVGGSSLVRGGRARTVFRDRVEPPVDLRQEPSPLEGFRRFRTGTLADAELFTVRGLAEGDRLRMATLDSYDGVVWHVRPGDRGQGSSSVFQRAGEELPVPEGGDERTVSVTVGDYDDPWMPTVGATRSVEFGGDRARTLSEEFRVNLATGSAAVPGGLRSGDQYTLDAVVADDGADLVVGDADPLAPVAAAERVDMVSEQAALFVSSLPADASPLEQVRRVAGVLRGDEDADGRRGYFSDGLTDEGQAPSRPGHSAERLRTLLDPESRYIVGNEEQYAAAMALMAIDRGLPARVVVGFVPEGGADGEPAVVTGREVSAWAEVAVEGVGWIPIDATPSDAEVPPDAPDIVPPPDRLVPPPVATTLTVPQPARTRRGDDEGQGPDDGAGGLAGLPTWAKVAGGIALPPLLIIGGGTAAMAALKARRRRQRRTRGTPAQQVAAGWQDVCDLARDMGEAVPQGATRREAAVLLGRTPEVGLPDLAGRADALAFGPEPVDPVAAAAYWDEVDLAREEMVGPLAPFDRWKVLVNPSSLRRDGHAREPVDA